LLVDSYNLYYANSPGVTPSNGTRIANVTSPYTHSGLTNGTPYYYVVTAVSAGTEGAESRQVSARPNAEGASAADLIPTALTASASSGVKGQYIAAGWSVANQGAKDAFSPWSDWLYLSTDETWDSGDTYFGSVDHLSNLPVNSSYSSSTRLQIPNLSSGSYYLLVKTDAYGGISESNEDNNVIAIALTINAPDLVPTALTAPSVVVPGQQRIAVSLTVENQGSGTALPGWNDYFYLSTDSTLDAQDTVLTGATQTQTLASAHSYTAMPESLNIPAVTAGSYFLIVKVDKDNNVLEADEANNVIAIALTVNAPDLVPTALTAPESVVLGQQIYVSWAVANQGNGNAQNQPTWQDYLYLSADENWGEDDLSLAYTYGPYALAAGSTYTKTAKVTLPSSITTSYHYLLLKIDKANNILESVETNNVLAKAISISLPDLVPLEFTAPTTTEVEIEETIIVSWTAENLGPGDVMTAWNDALYFSADTILDSGDSRLAWGVAPATLAAGASYSATVNAIIPNVSPGTYYLLLKADGSITVPESNEENNILTLAVRVKIRYTLTLATTGEGITNPTPGGHIYSEGNVVIITAVPAPNWQFDSWAGEGIADPHSASTTVTIDGNKLITANFVKMDCTLIINVQGEGTTTPSAGTYTFKAGDVINISAEPAAGYHFTNWAGEVANPSQQSTTVTIDALSKTISAVFMLNPVNLAPTFQKGVDQTISEDAGAQIISGWATYISAGWEEYWQTYYFIVSNDNNSLFSKQPDVDVDGTLTYTPAPDANGTAIVTVYLHDDGGTAYGGVDTSAVQTFAINVTPVNDAPSFTKGADQTVSENSGAHSVTGWATNISPGPPNESGQAVDFVTDDVDNTVLFSAGPAVDADGTLSYTLAPHKFGAANVTLYLHDDGGTSNGGVDHSLSHTFIITVNPAPAPTVTVITPNRGTTADNALSVTITGTGFINGTGLAAELNNNGFTPIAGTGVTWNSATQITCTFDLSGVTTNLGGTWDVKVTNPDTQTGTGSNLFTIYRPNPTLATITPSSGLNTGTVNITNLAGSDFVTGETSVKLTKTGQTNIDGTSVIVVNPGQITCTFDLTGQATGQWNVVATVTGAESPATLTNGFTINAPQGGKPTRTFLGSYPNPSVLGQSVQFIAVVVAVQGSNTPTVTFNNGQPSINAATQATTSSGRIPTGTVVFKDGGNEIGRGTLNRIGIATFTTSSLAVGKHTITAEYLGDANFSSSTSSFVIQIVEYITSTKLNSSPNPSTFGQSVQFTATVSSAGGTPTGSVTFKDGNKTLQTVPLSGGNTASFSTSALSAGSHNISAIYSGDDNYRSSSATMMQTVKKSASSTMLTSSQNPSNRGQSITVTATVTAVAPGAGTPTGKVVFKDGSTVLGSAMLNASGKATYSTSSLSRGAHNITAVYAGDANFSGSTSPPLSQTVQK
jgi:subtilase family serine protease